jgi:hypothetical protein
MPAYEGASLPNLTATVARHLRGDGDSLEGLAPALDPTVDPLKGRRPEGPVVILLVDGLGWSAFQRWTATSTTLAARRWSPMARPITTVFPTSTASALVSLSTGATPSHHGIVGYRQYLPAFGVVADMLKMTPVGAPAPEGLVGPQWTPSLITGVPSVFRRGLRGAAVSRDRFQETGFTRLLYDGAEYLPWTTASDLAVQISELLDRPRPPDLLLAYWDELDTVSHFYGPAEALDRFELDRIGHLVKFVAHRVTASIARKTSFWITGDHGQVPLDPERQIDLALHPAVTREMIRPLAGDRRASYLAARPGRLDRLQEAIEPLLPPGTGVQSMDAAIDAGLWGPAPFHPEMRERLGDLLILPPPPWGLVQRFPGSAPPRRTLFGAHGGLTPEELAVPLVGGTLDALGRGDG